jgi:hypothetical protein
LSKKKEVFKLQTLLCILFFFKIVLRQRNTTPFFKALEEFSSLWLGIAWVLQLGLKSENFQILVFVKKTCQKQVSFLILGPLGVPSAWRNQKYFWDSKGNVWEMDSGLGPGGTGGPQKVWVGGQASSPGGLKKKPGQKQCTKKGI